jgi:hypothetical protein
VAVKAGDLLGVPVDVEAGEVKAILVAGLPAGVGRQWANQLDANQPQAPPELRAALQAITRHVDAYVDRARLPQAA